MWSLNVDVSLGGNTFVRNSVQDTGGSPAWQPAVGKASECVQPTQVVVGAFLAGGTKATPLFQRDADPNLPNDPVGHWGEGGGRLAEKRK